MVVGETHHFRKPAYLRKWLKIPKTFHVPDILGGGVPEYLRIPHQTPL